MNEEILKKVESAKKLVVDGSLELWNARLSLLRSIGNIKDLVEHLKSPIEPVADNGNCGNCACGPESLTSQLSNPATR